MKHNQHIERDRELLLGLARNDDKALATIYTENFPAILRMVLQYRGTEDDAKDLFQEAMIVLFEKVRKGEFDLYSKLKTFLYAICRHLWLKKLQTGSWQLAMPDELGEMLPADDTNITAEHQQKDEQFRVMESVMGDIGEPCKTILEDYYVRKLSMQEIAEKFGYTNSENAKNQKYKCLMRLKKLFFEQYKS